MKFKYVSIVPEGEAAGRVMLLTIKNDTSLVEMRINAFDPTRPTESWRTAWRALTKKAGLPGLRFHDLRHHAITELAESGASEQTIMAIAGHVSRRMLERYSHVRIEAKRAALEALGGAKLGGHSTKGGTNMEDVPPLVM